MLYFEWNQDTKPLNFLDIPFFSMNIGLHALLLLLDNLLGTEN
jgi:hypothetical protein